MEQRGAPDGTAVWRSGIAVLMTMEISGRVLEGLAEKLDTLDLTDEERKALAMVLAAGIRAGLENPEAQGFMPTALLILRRSSTQRTRWEPASGCRVEVTYPWIYDGATNTDEWATW
jgi:hypothetical protein